MSWRPLTEILPVVDAGAARAAIVATGGVPEAHHQAPAQLFRAGLSTREQQQRDRAEEERAQAQEQARQSAHEDGLRMARAEGETLAVRYRGAIEELAHARDATIKACETDLVRLAMTIAREVVMADLPARESYAQRMAEHALGLLQGNQGTTLRMHPKDAASLRQHKPDLLRRGDVTLVEDEAMELGSVLAEGTKGRVDATLEARLRAMAEKLLPQNEVLT